MKAALRSLWDDPEIDEIQAADFETYPTLAVENVDIRVATPRTLVRMKAGTLRPVDQAGAASLRRLFGIEED